jgi:replicative DNA helicase
MSQQQLAQRILSSVSGIPLARVRSARISESEIAAIGAAAAQIASTQLVVVDRGIRTMHDVGAACRKLTRTNRLGMVMIDYLQLMTSSAKENRVQEVSEISRMVKALARDYDVPVLVLSQLSRGVEQRENKRPTLSDLRESGAIEQDADVVMALYRESYYERDDDSGYTEVIVLKHRNGPTGTVAVNFRGECADFVEV